MKQEFRWAPLALALVSALTQAATADRTSTVTYNAAGLVETIDGPRTDVSDVTRYAYNGQGRVSKTTNALGHVTHYENYNFYGSPGKVTDPNGVVTLLTYTPEGWLHTVTNDVNGSAAVTTMTYDAVGNVTKTSDPDGVVVHYTYDEASRLIDISDGAGNHIHYTLDAAGNRTKEDTVDTEGAVRRTVSRSFNSLSQLLTITDALHRTVLSFDPVDGYDAAGHPVHSRDGKGIQRKKGYDALNRLVRIIEDYDGGTPDTANTLSASSFDASDNLTGFIDPSGLRTTYGHNPHGDLTSIQSPDAGVTTFTVDAAGNRLTMTDARGVITTYSYDALNRIVSATPANSSLGVAYHYDEANVVTGCAISAPVGRITRIVEIAVTTTYCYDARGNVTEKRQTQGTATDTLHYAYTLGGRILSETRPSGNVVSYVYDALGQVTNVDLTPVGGTSMAVVHSITWLPFGPMQAYVLGNGQRVTRTFDANYRIIDVTSPAVSLHFSRDEMGKVIEATESGGSTARYLYDPLYRLVSVKQPADTVVEAYTYDPTGDRLDKTAPGTFTGVYLYKPGTHWLTSMGNASRNYDANGNTTGSSSGGDTWTYDYSERNRMTAVKRNGSIVGSYVYNASGERVAKTAGATSMRFIYDERSQLLAEINGTASRDYIAVTGVPLAVSDGSSTSFVVADGLGSPRAITSSNGDLVWSWPYATNPFGENSPVSASGFVFNLRFPGQYADDEAGLTYNIHRHFDPATGRYLQNDPLGVFAGPSLYSYVGGDPLNVVDFLGLCGLDCEAIIPTGPTDVSIRDNIYVMESLKHLSHVSGGIGVALKYRSFYEFVRNGGPWDFKQIKREYADFGNFHYGVVGAAGGIPDSLLLRAAGWAQTRSGNHVVQNGYVLGGAPYGDDPFDQQQIKNGIWWYNNCSTPSN